jgi:hypothetical protein
MSDVMWIQIDMIGLMILQTYELQVAVYGDSLVFQNIMQT